LIDRPVGSATVVSHRAQLGHTDGVQTPDVTAQSVGQPAGPLRSAVVVNPARVPGLAELREVVDSALAAAGWPAPDWLATTAEDPGTGQSRRAVEAGAQVVFVAGGDGTVRAAIAGLAGTAAALAVLPAGTGNLLATNLGLPLDPAEGVRVAVAGGRRQVDLGEVDGELFAVMAGMGFDAAVMDATSSKLKTRIGPLAYVLSAVPQLFGRPMRVRVLVDDEAPRRRHARAVLVGNVGRLQGGIRLLPDAEPDNGRMDVAIIAPRNLAHWAALALAVLLRREKVPRMEVLRGSRITISSDRPQPRELDGDVIDPGSSMEVIVRPGAFWLCVPQPDPAADLAG
jgi:YegS/Rv2252/BmrU family lipid kinase